MSGVFYLLILNILVFDINFKKSKCLSFFFSFFSKVQSRSDSNVFGFVVGMPELYCLFVCLFVYTYVCTYIHLRFKHALLDTHLSYLGCLSMTVQLLDVNKTEEGIMALHLPIGPLKPRSVLTPVPRCEPSTY